MTPWKPAKLSIVIFYKVRRREGFKYRGLGLHSMMKPLWGLYHLGSGHLVCWLVAGDNEACQIATEIAESGDWTFDGLDGWKNQFPDSEKKLMEISDRYSGKVRIPQGGGRSEVLALSLLMARENHGIKTRKRSRRNTPP